MTDLVNAESGKGKSAPTVEMDAGLYYPASYAIGSWVAYRQHGIMPESGAYNDQCEQWQLDMGTLNQRYNLAIWDASDRSEFIPDGFVADEWRDVFEG